MNIKKLQRLIVDALEDVKGHDIKVYNTTKLSDMFERLIIATGTSNRQTRALAMSVREAVKTAGGEVVSMEGEDTGEWVLVDCNDVVVHIMQPAIRQYYNLEELWGSFPVAMKLASKKSLLKSSIQEESTEELISVDSSSPAAHSRKPAQGPLSDEKRPASKKTGVKKLAVKKTPRKSSNPKK
ncbi:MAG: ribosome silencing factor [Burkholderiaceae bacterium]|nr:ribosome silencing factor [Burkholderiaceae bacterium]